MAGKGTGLCGMRRQEFDNLCSVVEGDFKMLKNNLAPENAQSGWRGLQERNSHRNIISAQMNCESFMDKCCGLTVYSYNFTFQSSLRFYAKELCKPITEGSHVCTRVNEGRQLHSRYASV